MTISAAQCRAARALIGWPQDRLAHVSKVAKATITNFEAGKRQPYERTLADVQAALEAAGVEFTNGDSPGVRLSEYRWRPFGSIPLNEEVEVRDSEGRVVKYTLESKGNTTTHRTPGYFGVPLEWRKIKLP